jgi:hypothetical protein
MCVYLSPLERLHIKERKFDKTLFLSFETVLEREKTAFYVTVRNEHVALAKKSIESTWKRVSVEKADCPFTEQPALTNRLSLERHYMFSLKTDKRTNSYLSNVLETLNSMLDGEKVYIQTLAVPASPDWNTGASEAYKRFKSGHMPAKFHLDKKRIVNTGVKLLAGVTLEACNLATEFMGGKESERIALVDSERALLFKDGSVSPATTNKMKGDAYSTEIRIGVVCNDRVRAQSLIRMACMSFRSLDGDNMLTNSVCNPGRMYKNMRERKFSIGQRDYFGIDELSRFHLLPTKEWQEKFKIPSISQLEMDIPRILTKSGLEFGHTIHKKEKMKVYYPTNNLDELCLPRVVTGKMGVGKSSYTINFALEAHWNGYGSVIVDPAKGETGDELESVIPHENFVRYRIGKDIIGLDWREVEHSTKARNRLANTILSFFDTSSADAGAQTARYIRAGVMAMRTGKLSEILRIFEDEEYRGEAIERMPDTIHKTTLVNFSNESDKRRAQILQPIYNRLDIILGDEFLNECMNTDEGLDMVDIMNDNKTVVIDVPQKELGKEVTDLVINIISSKIDLAMTLRDQENVRPFFVLYDELHQMQKSTSIWRSAVVESRKWRVGYVFAFHTMEQVPNDLKEIIKSAGPHYIFYNSSKKTFEEFKEEMKPFTIDDFLGLERFQAINVVNAGNKTQPSFIANMQAPPSKRKDL